MAGSGMPSALQFIVTGSFLGTVASMGCSTIRGRWKAGMRRKKQKENQQKSPQSPALLNLIKLKVLFSVFAALFSVHSLCLRISPTPQSNYGFSASSVLVAKPTKHQIALNIKNDFQLSRVGEKKGEDENFFVQI